MGFSRGKIMWDFIRSVGASLGPEIIIGGMVALFFVSILVVSRLEKHHIHQFIPAHPDESPPASPYFQAMNDMAPSLGNEYSGNFIQSRGSALYKCRLALWVSADRNTLVVIGGGKLAKIDYKRTLFITVVDDDRVLVTMDDFGVWDLSGIREIEVVMNADLNELHERHGKRLAGLSVTPRHFSPQPALQQYEGLELQRVEKMVRMGLAEFVDMSHTIWRYTFKGAWRSAYEGFFKGFKNAKTQSDRMKIKRPGS